MARKYERQTGSFSKNNVAVEDEIVETLERTLRSPWTVEVNSQSLDLFSEESPLHYTPDVLIKNEATGKILAVEIKNDLSLSMANVIRFQRIQSAYQDIGSEFLLVVHGEDSDAHSTDARLNEYGINSVEVSRADEAAWEIEKHLPSK